ncbi:CBS domain-containing protein [Sulfolobus sp. S-194]|uniref:CBS domain-containing protein n=1 Tax=Sulfolobus sp. S-194 TaxID=2512240 RepID=UPI0014372B6D|nr:CBS domain-containing protein [Sulfolobus sp. S-194]QIW25089.1 CBS domain-containing protein [Sulfolobus sp. S-194]
MIPKELLEEPKVVASYNDRVREVISRMQENNQWVVPVVRDKVVIGVISYNELLRRKVSPESKVINLMIPSNNVLESEDEARVVAKFYTTKSRALIVVDDKKRLVGIITREGFLSYYLNKGEIPDAKVREVMNSPVIIIDSNDSVARARWLMSNNHISKLPVLENKKLVGIVTTRDIVNRLYSEGGKKKSSILTEEERLMALPVREIMTYPVITTDGNQNVKQALETLLKRKISGMPVVEGDLIVGMFSGIDVVNLIAKKFELEMPIEAKLSGELKQGDVKAMIDGILERYLARLEKLTEVINFKVTFKEVAKSQDKKVYQVTARAVTKIGDFISKDSDWDPVTAVRKAVEKLEERVTRELKKIEEKGRKPKAEEG